MYRISMKSMHWKNGYNKYLFVSKDINVISSCTGHPFERLSLRSRSDSHCKRKNTHLATRFKPWLQNNNQCIVRNRPMTNHDRNHYNHINRIHKNYYINRHLLYNDRTVTFQMHGRYIHMSSWFMQEDPKEDFKVLDDKNKIEEYIEHKRKKLEQKEKIRVASAKFQDAFIFKVDRSLMEPENKDKTKDIQIKKPLKDKIIDEIKHYYNGFRLLFLDVKISARLLWTVLNGNTLTRRERKQFLRTAADLFKLLPFSVFIIVPFMEFLLPVAIKLFPGMLPSTFEDKKTKESKRRASLKVKLQMAEFLQDTIEEIALVPNSKKPSKKLNDFANFVAKARSEVDRPTNIEIMKYSKLFEDEITLENIRYHQLTAICRLLMLSPIGTANFLRFKIKMKLKELKADDQIIRREGIDNLTSEELQNACIARGIRALGVPLVRLKSDLKQWLELSLDENIPTSLLLLSRAIFMKPAFTVDEQLKVTIGMLPERLIDEMEVKIAEVEGEAVDRQTIIDIIKHEEEKIKQEKKQISEEQARKKMEILQEGKAGVKADISKEEMLKVIETISTDRDDLDKIKEDREEYIEDLKELKQVEDKAKENVASKRLGRKIDTILEKVQASLKEIGDEKFKEIDKDEDGVVSTQELFDAIMKVRDAPDEIKTQRLMEILDEDKDGSIDLEELKVITELIETEDLDLTNDEIEELISLMKHSEKRFVVDQMFNKKKTNYILRILPQILGKKLKNEND